MLSVLLGLGLSMHLMTAQAVKSSLEQTLVVSELNTAKVCYVKWEWNPSV